MSIVLIVEDEEPLRVLAESILQDAGHKTLTAKNAEEAFALFAEDSRIDAILTDMVMDGREHAGVEVATAFREKFKYGTVVYTSGAGVTDGTRALFVAFSTFLPKPYTAQQLVDAMTKALVDQERPPENSN